jgi:hypothetical protein
LGTESDNSEPHMLGHRLRLLDLQCLATNGNE